jgi:hypothetical protein
MAQLGAMSSVQWPCLCNLHFLPVRDAEVATCVSLGTGAPGDGRRRIAGAEAGTPAATGHPLQLSFLEISMAVIHGDGPTSAEVAHKSGKTLDVVALILMIVGGLNWGLVGLFRFDLVAALFGEMTTASRVVYTLVGLAALYGIATASHFIKRTP